MILETLRPDPILMVGSLFLALLLDVLYPEHRGLMLRIHPVHTSYYMALALGKPYSSRFRGFIVWLLVILVHVTPAVLLLIVAYHIHPLAWVIASAFILKFSLSLKLLVDICYNAYKNLTRNLDEARRWAQMIVRRDVSKLDQPRVISAVLESMAESLVDGYTSPLLYYILLGPPGALIQRIANTLDGALGYKTPEYRDVGWFSARADTLINYIPARLTAIHMITLAPIARGSITQTYRTWRRWSRATESQNAGHPMSALAGVLNVKLEKPKHYTLNPQAREPLPEDIIRGLKLTLATATIYTITMILLMIFI